jgi:hypothetical protein
MARAAKNGVILITLKKGKMRRGLGIDYNFNYRSIQPYRFRDVQNTFGAGGPVSENEPAFDTEPDGTPVYPKDINNIDGPGGKTDLRIVRLLRRRTILGPAYGWHP